MSTVSRDRSAASPVTPALAGPTRSTGPAGPPETAIPAPAPLSARRRATRERLVDAALTVFAGTGIEGASVEHICEAAGFTRGAFYSNFADKDELLVALIERQIAAVTAAIGGGASTPGAPPDAVIGEKLEAVLQVPGFGDDYYARHAEVRLHVTRTGAPALRDACRRLDETVAAAVVAALAQVGREPIVSGADLVSVLEGIVTESHHRAFLDGDGDPGRLARATVTPILYALTREVREAAGADVAAR